MTKRLSNTILVFVLLTALTLFSVSDNSAIGKTLTSTDQEYAYVTLDSMEAEYHPANKVVIVKGSIKNISRIVLRGHLVLHILSISGAVLHSTEMPIKGHQPIMNGESVSFDTVLNVSNVSGAAKISADFTWD
ncbi:MAG: hypothetical protein KKG47_05355 [Proteobacteria bacterium]|nr:hypothetical protein [Pseudomonadota bacterium]MBU1736903.1 hypothetical protein [Pseudomonadota bacterium]